MTKRALGSVAALALWAAGCSKPAPPPVAEKQPAAEPMKITQFYATTPELPRGEKELICYGVEHAKTVWLSPPRQELSPSYSRCVEVAPEHTTTYTLTAEDESGHPATKTLTVTVGPARPKAAARTAKVIRNVTVTTLHVKPGQSVGICYEVENARTVTIAPLNYHGGSDPKGCTVDQPHQTTTYVISATGASGEKDEEKVTVKVE